MGVSDLISSKRPTERIISLFELWLRHVSGHTVNSLLVAECGMNVHHKCEKKVANLCGVNQKLMAEALAMIGSKQQVRRANPLLQMDLVFYGGRRLFPKLL